MNTEKLCECCGVRPADTFPQQMDPALPWFGVRALSLACWVETYEANGRFQAIAERVFFERIRVTRASKSAEAGEVAAHGGPVKEVRAGHGNRDTVPLCATPECSARGVEATHGGHCVYCDSRDRLDDFESMMGESLTEGQRDERGLGSIKLRLPKPVLDKLDRDARRIGCSRSKLIETLIAAHK